MKIISKLKAIFVSSVTPVIVVSTVATISVFSSFGVKVTNTKPTTDSDNFISWGIDDNAVSGGLENKTKEELQEEVNKKLLDGMINISMNLNPVFEDGTSKGNLLIVNEEINKYPQVVQIFEDETGEMIYQSGLIPVGSKVETATLDKDLDAGVYSCTAYFNSVNEDNGNFIGTAGAKITIIVEK